MTSVGIVKLDKSVLTLFLKSRKDTVLEISLGGGGYPPPFVGEKLTQILVGARVKLPRLTLACTWGDATPPDCFSWLYATFVHDRPLIFA